MRSLLIPALALAAACGGGARALRSAAATAAEAVRSGSPADKALRGAYDDALAGVEGSTPDEAMARYGRLERAYSAMLMSRRALRSLDAALESGADPWRRAACASRHLLEVGAALAGVGLDVPDGLLDALAALAGASAELCDE